MVAMSMSSTPPAYYVSTYNVEPIFFFDFVIE